MAAKAGKAEKPNILVRIDAWKMHVGAKKEDSWWNKKYYPSVPYIFSLLMDSMAKMESAKTTNN